MLTSEWPVINHQVALIWRKSSALPGEDQKTIAISRISYYPRVVRIASAIRALNRTAKMVRILVINAGNDLKTVVPKVEKIHNKNGPFFAVLLVHAPSEAVAMPVQTYFAAPTFQGETEPCEVASNLHYVGRYGLKILNGLSVFLSGEGVESAFHGGADVLVSSAPAGVGHDAASARLGIRVKPRYHFFSGGEFQKYEPFVLSGCLYVTRLVQLADCNGGKWVFAADMKAKTEIKSEEIGVGKMLYKVVEGRSRKRRREECWFCLCNKVEEHLVTYVGENVYVAIAKGGLNESHLVIVPVKHVTGCSDIDSDTLKEIEDMMRRIEEYFRNENGGLAFFFERVGNSKDKKEKEDARKSIMHMCIQAICVGKDKYARLVEQFEKAGKQFGFEQLRLEKREQGSESGMSEVRRHGWQDAFWAQVGMEKQIAVELTAGKYLPPTFGRLVAAITLGMETRLEWRQCMLARKQEEEIAERLTVAMRPFMSMKQE